MDNVSDNRSEITTFKSVSSGDIHDQIERVYFRNFAGESNSPHESHTSFSSASTSSFNDFGDPGECASIVEYELRRLSANKADIKLKLKQLQAQASLVSRRISDNILQNSQAYSNELQVCIGEFLTLDFALSLRDFERYLMHNKLT